MPHFLRHSVLLLLLFLLYYSFGIINECMNKGHTPCKQYAAKTITLKRPLHITCGAALNLPVYRLSTASLVTAAAWSVTG